MSQIPNSVMNANGDEMPLFFHKYDNYWVKRPDGSYFHPANRMPKTMAFRSLRAEPSLPGIVNISYMFRMKGNPKGECFRFSVCKEVWACCLAKWTGYSISTLFTYVSDYIEHPDKMESEMFSYSYDDWKNLMEKDGKKDEKVKMGRERYARSLATYERYRYKYREAGFEKEDLTFDIEDDVSCYAAYHRATPTYINSVIGIVPMWQQMEYFKERW